MLMKIQYEKYPPPKSPNLSNITISSVPHIRHGDVPQSQMCKALQPVAFQLVNAECWQLRIDGDIWLTSILGILGVLKPRLKCGETTQKDNYTGLQTFSTSSLSCPFSISLGRLLAMRVQPSNAGGSSSLKGKQDQLAAVAHGGHLK